MAILLTGFVAKSCLMLIFNVREAGILPVCFFPKLMSVFSWKQNQGDGDNN